MSRLNELIQQYCPDGVEYKKLGDVCEFIKDGTHGSYNNVEDGYPLLSAKDINNGVISIPQDCRRISKEDYNSIYKKYKLLKGDVLITIVGSIGRTAIVGDGIEVAFQRSVGILRPLNIVLSSYLSYALQTSSSQKKLAARTSKSAQGGVYLGELSKIEIPVPPLPVQEEIVRILDNFTELQAELQAGLQAELQKRLQQYNYYRDNLLSFEGRTDVEWKKLGDVATDWYRGAGIKRDEVSEEGIPCIRYGEIHTTYNIWFNECISHTDENQQPAKKYADYGDILFAITSEDIPFIGNSVAYIGKERILVGGDIVVMKHTQNPKYMSYALSTSDAVMQKGKGKVKSKVVHTSVPSLKEIVVPIPSLEEQEKIASILDRFYTLTADITAGLPAEIEARRKQYEYYRDKLLTFQIK